MLKDTGRVDGNAAGKPVHNASYQDVIEGTRVSKQTARAKSAKRKKTMRQRTRKILLSMICSFILCCIISVLVALGYRVYSSFCYDKAKDLINEKRYQEAADRFKALSPFRDSEILYQEALILAENQELYQTAMEEYENEDFQTAADVFAQLDDYEDSKEMRNKCLYNSARIFLNVGQYDEASKILLDLQTAMDNSEFLTDRKTELAEMNYMATSKSFTEQQKKLYQQGITEFAAGNYEAAKRNFSLLDDFEDSEEMVEECELRIRRIKAATTISTGIQNSMAIREDGKVVVKGNTLYGQDKVADWNDVISISCFGRVTIGLQEDGTVLTATTMDNINTSSWENIIAVSAGEGYAVGLRSDGRVESTGHDAGDGQRNVSSWEDIVSIATGWRHTVGLDSSGTVHITGFQSKLQERQIRKASNDWKNIIAIAAGGGSSESDGDGHTVGLRKDGRVFAVGDNKFGQCNVENWENIVAIAAGDWHTVGLTGDGKVVAVGTNSLGDHTACEVDDWEGIVAIAAGTGITLGLKEDGTVLATGYTRQNQCPSLGEWTGIKMPADITTKTNHSVVE